MPKSKFLILSFARCCIGAAMVEYLGRLCVLQWKWAKLSGALGRCGLDFIKRSALESLIIFCAFQTQVLTRRGLSVYRDVQRKISRAPKVNFRAEAKGVFL